MSTGLDRFALATTYLFSKPDNLLLDKCYSMFEVRNYKAGDTIIDVGANRPGYFVVISGDVVVSASILVRYAKSSARGSLMGEIVSVAVDRIVESDCFGEEFVLDETEASSVKYTANSDCEVYVCSTKAMAQIMNGDDIVRDRLIVMNNAKKSRRDIVVDSIMKIQAQSTDDEEALDFSKNTKQPAEVSRKENNSLDFLQDQKYQIRTTSFKIAARKDFDPTSGPKMRDSNVLEGASEDEGGEEKKASWMSARKRTNSVLNTLFSWGRKEELESP